MSCPEKLLTTYLGTTYAFPQCNITGNPPTVISWRREFGSLSNFRTVVNNKHQLEILNVETSDEGTYVVRAHNCLGKDSIHEIIYYGKENNSFTHLRMKSIV